MVFESGKKLCKDNMVVNTEWAVTAHPAAATDLLAEFDYWTMRRAQAFTEAPPEMCGGVGSMQLVGEVR